MPDNILLTDILSGGTNSLRTELTKGISITAILQNAVSASGNGTDFTIDGYGVATLQIIGTFVATVTFYGSVNGTNFGVISAYDRNLGINVLSTTNTGLFEINCKGLSKIRAVVTWTSGTSITIVGKAEPFSGIGGSSIVNKNTAGNEIFTDVNPGSMKLTGRNVVLTATILSGQSLSGEIDLQGYQMLAIRIPAAWDTANITFLGARATTANGGTYVPVYDDAGLEVTVTVGGADRMITLDINALKLASLQYIKLRSGTSGSPVNQTADRTLYLIGKV